MTSPDHNVPEGATTIATLSDLQALDEDKIRRELKSPATQALDIMRESLVTNIIGGIGKAIHDGINGAANSVGEFFEGIFSAGKVVKAVKDGQLSLINRTDTLEGLNGFGAAYQTQNINSEWNIFGDNSRYLPYDGQMTALKATHIEPGKNLVMDEKGVWLIYVCAHVRRTGWDGSDLSAIYVDIVRPNGEVVKTSTFDRMTGKDYGTVDGYFPAVIPEPGCWIRVRAWSGRWRWWDGGTDYSWIAAVKQDNRTDGDAPGTVPDEPKPQGV